MKKLTKTQKMIACYIVSTIISAFTCFFIILKPGYTVEIIIALLCFIPQAILCIILSIAYALFDFSYHILFATDEEYRQWRAEAKD